MFSFWERDTERERERLWAGKGQRERETESEEGSWPWAVSTEPDMGLKLMDREIMTWAEVICSTNWAIQVPQEIFLHIKWFFFIESITHISYLNDSRSYCNNFQELALFLSFIDRGRWDVFTFGLLILLLIF